LTKKAVISVKKLGKCYRIGQREQYKTLQDAMVAAAKAPLYRIKKRLSSDNENHDLSHIWALKDVSFEVEQGEVMGIIGRNGSGKSTLLKILSRITSPTEGSAEIHGRVGSLLEVGTGFHPELTGRENIYLSGTLLGMRKNEIDEKFDDIVKFSEIEKFLDTPVKRYSSGMYVRLAFAVAANLDPEILMVDEVLAVGDAAFQKKCLGKMESVAEGGRTVLFVSHNMPAVLNFCNHGLLIEKGKIKTTGSIENVIDIYLAENIAFEGEIVFENNASRPKSDLRFISARILHSDGRSTAFVDYHKGFYLEIVYDVYKPIRKAQIAFELWNSTGICILCSTDLDNQPNTEITKLPGRHKASCYVPPEYLRPGRYTIDIGSSVPGIQILDEIQNALAFEVINTGNIEFKLSQGRRGVITPLLNWNTLSSTD